MEVLALIIAIVALALAVVALHRTGGVRDLAERAEKLSSKALEQITTASEGVVHKARERTAGALERLEESVRPKESSDKERPE